MPIVGPPPQLVSAVERLAPGVYRRFFELLNTAHRGLRVQPTSYWRSSSDNRRVGGAGSSQHLVATAIDLVYASRSDREAGKRAMQRLGLTVIDEGDHVHVQAWPGDVGAQVVRRVIG